MMKFNTYLKYFLVLVLLLNGTINISTQASNNKQLNFTVANGLPRNIVNCIDLDNFSYLWVGTANGLARFNGVEFKTYEEFAHRPIFALFVDSKNKVWVGSGNGLFLYNRLTDSFENKDPNFVKKITEYSGQLHYLSSLGIYKVSEVQNIAIKLLENLTDFCITPFGIWYYNNNTGSNLLSNESKFSNLSKTTLENKNISAINYINNKTYFGCRNGQLFCLNQNNKLEEVNISNHYTIKKIKHIHGDIWIATGGNGIIVLNEDNQVIKTYNRENTNGTSINSNSILDILQGKNDETWVATYGAGLTCILPDNLLFKTITPEEGSKNTLIANEGVYVSEENNTFYFGTNYGLSVWDEHSNTFFNKGTNELKKELNGYKILAVCSTNKNKWIATYDGLLGKYTKDLKFIESIFLNGKSANEMQQIIYMHNYNDTNLLIATHYLNRSLIKFNIIDQSISLFKLENNGSLTTQFFINSLRKNDNNDIIALVPYRGLFKVNFNTGLLENINTNLNSFFGVNVLDFYIDNKGNYWLATNSDGLLHLSPDTSIIKRWTVHEGLPSNSLVRIESMDSENLWISTISGLCRLNMETGSILNFNDNNGLQINEYSDRTSCKTSDNRIVFGSYNGFTIINPDKIKPDTSQSKVVISDITFQNTSIKSNDNEHLLKAPLEETNKLKLPFNKNSFTIHFFTKNNVTSENNNYKYRLIGLEDNWITLNKSNQTTYTNLNPGTYTFEIYSTNNEVKQKDNFTSLQVIINPPWYKRWYAYLLYYTILFSLFFAFLYAYRNRLNYKNEIKMSAYKIQQEQDLTEKKLAFFTNISHDLKTPLTLIDAPAIDLLNSENLTNEQKNKLLLIRNNSKRLFKLISDLIDFRKLTQNKVSLTVTETNVNTLLDSIYSAFKTECINKNIELDIDVAIDHNIYIDPDKIEKIVWNLMSNAIKYTNNGGKISLQASEIKKEGVIYLNIFVKDSGIGISKEHLNKIFDRFYQVQNNKSVAREGTGIGLSIVSDLIAIHKGEIHVESSLNLGSCFIVSIPCDKDFYSDAEFSLKPTENNLTDEKDENTDQKPLEIEQDVNKQYNLPVLLIVEDNFDLRQYLSDHFKKFYKIYQASDGQEGLQIAQDKNIDVVITDVTMPNMNGYELCQELRLKFETSHIPVIILTANSSIEHQIEGLSTGADIYLTKPIDIQLLDTAVKTILENRKKIRNKFLGTDTTVDQDNLLTEKDEAFLSDLKSFINDNLINENLDVDMLSKHFSVNRAQLNRKIKSLTGKTTIKLIVSLRLKKAYELIRKEGMRVSEAAYNTGFSDPNYFTICFKKEFGENPSKI